MGFNILPADTYTVINKTVLNNVDYQILIMLYQPIIGTDAISLYLTLWSYLDKDMVVSDTWTHHHLMLSMRTKLISIVEAKERLEAIGLIKTYFKKGDINHFVYELYSPLSCYEFVENPILGTSLYNNVGKKEYERIIKFFAMPKINLNEYEDITLSFTDVFTSEPFTSIEKLIDDIKKNNKRDLELKYKVDIDHVLNDIPESLINHKSITKDTKELLGKLSFIYNLSEDALNKIIINSLADKKIDKELLKNNSRNLYKFENDGHLPSIIFRNQPDYLKNNIVDNTKKARLIHQFESTSPYEFLSLKNGNTNPNRNDLKLLEELLVELELEPGVVNVLIDYVLRINDNKLNRAFVMAIASQWKRSNIKNVVDAMSIAEKEQSKKKPNNIKVKNATKPVWIDQKFDKEEASLEEQEKLNELLKNFK